jgi:gliding motility-associated-like protein
VNDFFLNLLVQTIKKFREMGKITLDSFRLKLFICGSIFLSASVFAQTPNDALLFNNGALIYTAANAIMHVNGGVTNSGATAQLINHGDLTIVNDAVEGSIFLVNSSVAEGNGRYFVEKDWSNSAIFNAGNSEVILNGSSAEQLITGTVSTTFNNLTLTNTLGNQSSRVKRMTLDASVSGILAINDRLLATNDNTMFVINPSVNAITYNNTAGSEGFVSSDFVSTGLGALSRQTNTNQTYVFPVGSATGTLRYRAVEITPATSTANTYTVRMANVDATSEGFDRNDVDQNVCQTNANFYHRINRTVGTDAADVKIFFNAAADGNWAAMAQWNVPANALWNDMGAVTAQAGTPYSSITKSATNNFGSANTPFILSDFRPDAPEIMGDQLICGNSQAVTYIADGNPGSTYTWIVDGGTIVSDSTGNEIEINWSNNPPGTITVIENGVACSSMPSTPYIVNFYPAPAAGFDTTSSGPLSQLYAFTDTSSGATTWFWDFGDGATSASQNPAHNYPNSGTYTVMQVVTTSDGCTDTIYSEITINEGIIIPNVFSPNGDGVNDLFYIPNTGLGDYHIAIFNRWGNKIWETTGTEIRWDGRTTAGVHVPDGTYFYTLRAVSSSEGKQDYSRNGTVNIFR